MNNKAISDGQAPFMVRLQDTDACAIMMLGLNRINHDYSFNYDQLVTSIGQLFPETRSHGNGHGWYASRKIAKLEARWLPRRGYESEGYPQTILLDQQNGRGILRMILLRQGTDIIEATLVPV